MRRATAPAVEHTAESTTVVEVFFSSFSMVRAPRTAVKHAGNPTLACNSMIQKEIERMYLKPIVFGVGL